MTASMPLYQLFEQILDQHAPVKKAKIRSHPSLFITPEICELMRTRDKWKKLTHKSNNPLAWAGFRNYEREVKCETRIAEREFVRDQIANNQTNSSGNLWKTVRSIIPRKSSSCLVYNQDKESVTDSFNKFFTLVSQTIVDKIKALASKCNHNLMKTTFVPTCYPLSDHFSFHPVNCKQVEQITSLLPSNKAPGFHKISTHVIKDGLSVILSLITHVINASLARGIFPGGRKQAEVTPTPKQGDHKQPQDL